jgi:PPOX class probable F420-dependent enzyme
VLSQARSQDVAHGEGPRVEDADVPRCRVLTDGMDPASAGTWDTVRMDLDRARDFVRSHHRAVLATRSEAGIQQSPVLVGVDEAGRLTISSRETAYKTRHLRRDPWAQLCVLNDGFFGDWVYVEGEAEVVSLPDAMEPLVDYYRGIAGEADDWDAYRAGMERERRVIIRVTPHRAGPDRQG